MARKISLEAVEPRVADFVSASGNCYKGGTLGDSNFGEIEKQLLLISKKQKYRSQET